MTGLLQAFTTSPVIILKPQIIAWFNSSVVSCGQMWHWTRVKFSFKKLCLKLVHPRSTSGAHTNSRFVIHRTIPCAPLLVTHLTHLTTTFISISNHVCPHPNKSTFPKSANVLRVSPDVLSETSDSARVL